MTISERHDYLWKIAIGGAGGVGKTTFMLRYLTEKFVSTTSLTIGVQFHSHELEHDGKRIQMLFWDLGGQDRFRFMQSTYMKGSVAALLFFDAARISSVFELGAWIDMIRKHAMPGALIVLVGTKTDVIDDNMRQFAMSEGQRVVDEHGLESLVLTSSKTGENIKEAVLALVDTLLWKVPRAIPAMTETTIPSGHVPATLSPGYEHIVPFEPVHAALSPRDKSVVSIEHPATIDDTKAGGKSNLLSRFHLFFPGDSTRR